MKERTSSGDAVATMMVAVLFIVAAVVYFKWTSIVRMTADASDEHTMLWLEATDVAPGDTLEARVRVQDGMRIAILGVTVTGAGEPQLNQGHLPTWGDQITAGRLYDKEEASDELGFSVRVPREARAGEVLHLAFALEYVTAEREYTRFGFENREHASTFRIDVPVHGGTASTLRRVGKAALAVGLWLVVVIASVVGSRWHGRRRREASGAWLLLIVPYLLAGWFGFARMLADATRVHGWWFMAAAVVVWFLAFVVSSRITARDALRRYLVRQARIPAAVGDAYRSGGMEVPTRTMDELSAAWQAAGMLVEPKGAELVVTKFGTGVVLVTVPASGSFGGGEAFELRSEDAALVDEVIAAAAKVLGELRSQLADAGTLGDDPATLAG